MCDLNSEIGECVTSLNMIRNSLPRSDSSCFLTVRTSLPANSYLSAAFYRMEVLPIKLSNLGISKTTEDLCESGVLEGIPESVKCTARWIIQTCTSNHWSTSYPSAIFWTLAKDQANDYQQRVEAMPSFTMLCEVLRAGAKLVKLCNNPTFVSEFFPSGGLSLLM